MRPTSPRSPEHCRAGVCEELVDACATTPGQAVTIVGTGQIDLLAALCRRGVARAACRAPQGGPHDPAAPADLLIIVDPRREPDLRRALGSLGRTMRAGSRVVLRLAGHLSSGRLCRLRRLLAEYGFGLTWMTQRLSDGSGLCFARKRPALAHAA